MMGPHERPPVPLRFAEEATLPETKRHLLLRTLLFMFLRRAVAHRACVGSEQFVYWNASDPRCCLAPDAFVRLGTKDELFGSWKTWERGSPDVALEIVSDSDASGEPWEKKIAAYHELGVCELVRFDADAPSGARLRVWERVEGALVERVVEGDRAKSALLGLTWVTARAEECEIALRIEMDDGSLVPTPTEAEYLAGQSASDRARIAEDARDAAVRRVAELEAELARRGG